MGSSLAARAQAMLGAKSLHAADAPFAARGSAADRGGGLGLGLGLAPPPANAIACADGTFAPKPWMGESPATPGDDAVRVNAGKAKSRWQVAAPPRLGTALQPADADFIADEGLQRASLDTLLQAALLAAQPKAMPLRTQISKSFSKGARLPPP